MRFEQSEELSVSLCDLSGAIHADDVAVIRSDLNHNASFVPLPRSIAMLVLDYDMIACFEGRELSGASGQPVLHAELSVTVRLGSGVCCLSPVLSQPELAGLERERVPHCSAKHNLSRTEACDGAGCVPVHQNSLDELVSVQGPGLGGVASNDPLGMLNSKLRPLVSPGIVSRGHSVNDTPLRAEVLKQFRCENFCSV